MVSPAGATVWTTAQPSYIPYGNVRITTDPFVVNTGSSLAPNIYFGAASLAGNIGVIYSANAATGALTQFNVTNPTAITSASETGTTVTITMAATTGFTVGQTVSITGIEPPRFDGLFPITGLTGTTLTYTVGVTGLGTGTLGTAFASRPLLGTPISISSDGTDLFVRTEYHPPIITSASTDVTYIYALTAAGILDPGWAATNPVPAGSANPGIVGHGALVLDTAPIGPAHLYYTTADGKLIERDADTGAIVKSVQAVSGTYAEINLNAAAGIVYVTDCWTGSIHAYTAAGLVPLWTFRVTGNSLLTAPALATTTAAGAGALYFAATAHNLYSINALTGLENWDVSLSTLIGTTSQIHVGSSTVIDKDGNIILEDQILGAICIGEGAGAPAGVTGGGILTTPGGTILAIGGVIGGAIPALVAGQGFTATATVTPDPTSSLVPTGSVDFFANGIFLGTAPLNGSGVATFVVPGFALPAGIAPAFAPGGPPTLSAVYSSDPNFYASTASATLTVNAGAASPQSTTAALSVSPSSTATYGDAVTLTATVTSGTGTPTGNVNFMDGSTVLATATLNSSGVAAVIVNNISAGARTITASYVGDGNFNASTSTGHGLTVAPAALTITATNFSELFGDAPILDEANGFTATGLQAGDTIGYVTLNTNATTTSGNWNVGAWTITPSAPDGGLGSNYTVTYVAGTLNVFQPIAVSSVVVNGGTPAYTDSNGLSVSLAGQNSIVEQILVTFNQAVTLDSGAFTITNNAAGVTVYNGPAPSTLAVTANFAVVPGSGNTQYIVTFSGPGTLAIPGGSGAVIDNGLYILNTIGPKVHANGFTAPADNQTGFWALFGSAVSSDNVLSSTIGDGNSEVFVDNFDYSLFRSVFGSESDIPNGPPAYDPALDYNLSGYIDNFDYSAFDANFGADWVF